LCFSFIKILFSILFLSFLCSKTLATTSFGSVVRVNLSSLQSMTLSESHTNTILKVAFDLGASHGGERFATISSDGSIKVWDLAEYAVISTSYPRKEQERGVTPLSLAFANILFSGWSDGRLANITVSFLSLHLRLSFHLSFVIYRVLAHSAETGENLWMLENAHTGGVSSLVLSYNRRFILTGGPQGEVRLWELRTRELISHLKEHKQKITNIRLYHDDTLAVSGSRDRCMLRWDLRNEVSVSMIFFLFSFVMFFLCLSLFLETSSLSYAANGWYQRLCSHCR
jgi:WD40 repeat protein